MAAGDENQAIVAYRRTIKLKSTFVAGYKKLAAALDGAGRDEEAIDAYRTGRAALAPVDVTPALRLALRLVTVADRFSVTKKGRA